MKKLLISVLPVLLLCLPAGDLSAQERSVGRWEVDFTLGGASMLPQIEGINGRASVYSTSLQEIYAPYFSDVSSGTLFGVAAYVPVRPSLEVGVDSAFDRIIATRFDPVTDRETGLLEMNAVSALAGLRLVYLKGQPDFRMYSGFSLGAAYSFGKDTGVPFGKMRFAAEITLVGLRYGPDDGHWRLVMEMVSGSRLSGGRFGVGYRF